MWWANQIGSLQKKKKKKKNLGGTYFGLFTTFFSFTYPSPFVSSTSFASFFFGLLWLVFFPNCVALQFSPTHTPFCGRHQCFFFVWNFTKMQNPTVLNKSHEWKVRIFFWYKLSKTLGFDLRFVGITHAGEIHCHPLRWWYMYWSMQTPFYHEEIVSSPIHNNLHLQEVSLLPFSYCKLIHSPSFFCQ